MNAYALSKSLIDIEMAKVAHENAKRVLRGGGTLGGFGYVLPCDYYWSKHVVGIKPFNVFGYPENHKVGMESMVLQAYRQIKSTDLVNLFKSYKGEFKDGEQRRDFLYVKDAAKAIVDVALDISISGLYNLGSGWSTTWNELVGYVFEAMGKKVSINYIEMPEVLRGKYQYATCADMTKLRGVLPNYTVTPLKYAIMDYVKNYLEKD